jgi:N-acetylgalactosamine-6-sulfatase
MKHLLSILLFCPFLLLAQQPNIIMILADDWGYGDVAVYGNGQPSPVEGGTQQSLLTPNLDGMAAEGMMYTQFYVNAAVCSPTRASIMKGQFTRRHGVHSHLNDEGGSTERGMPNWVPTDYPVLPKILKEAGYATAHYGKWHLTITDRADAPTPPDYGIDEHIVTVGSGAGVHEMAPGVAGWNIFRNTTENDPLRPEWRAQASAEIMDSTISFIERHQSQPFYIQAWIFDSHGELYPTAEQKAPYASLTEDEQVYYGVLTDSDTHIGRVLTRLQGGGLYSGSARHEAKRI